MVATVRLGFNYVLDAFHVVNRADVPVRFFVDERKSRRPSIRLTDEFLRMRETFQFANFAHEVEARWRLVETPWQADLPRRLVVGIDETAEGAVVLVGQRRPMITRARNALNGYQKGRCFYCYDEVAVADRHPRMAHVDHFSLACSFRAACGWRWTTCGTSSSPAARAIAPNPACCRNQPCWSGFTGATSTSLPATILFVRR